MIPSQKGGKGWRGEKKVHPAKLRKLAKPCAEFDCGHTWMKHTAFGCTGYTKDNRRCQCFKYRKE